MADHSISQNNLLIKNQSVTRFGKFLRRTNIDEIPQFINVFLGQMSIVGPRPHMLKHTEQYRKVVRMFMLRHIVKPGITGHAQVHGYRGEIRKISDIQKRVELDVEYLENWSINLDIKIILKTILISITGQQEA
jgi:putative colanic acid biosynthesis UDP-glucose lipid carrier transferase